MTYQPELGRSTGRITYRECDRPRGGKDDRGDASRADERSPGPEKVHLSEHPAKVRAGQVSGPKGVTVNLTPRAIDRHHILNHNIQRGRHGRSFGRRGDPKGGLEAEEAENVEGEVDRAEIKHDGREDHGHKSDCCHTVSQ